MAAAASDRVIANRAVVLGLGWYGARAIAHLWPRLRIEDLRREHAQAGLPLLRHLVSMVLVLADAEARLVIGRPDAQKWNGAALRRSILPAAQREDASGLQILRDSLEQWKEFGESDGTAARRTCFVNALRNQRGIGDLLVQVAEAALIDAHAPGRGVHRLSVYVLAALSEERASALLWPLVTTIRDRLGQRTALEVVGLLSTGAYGDATTRRDEGARIYAALRELEFFSQEEPNLALLKSDTTIEAWLPRQPNRYLDRCYLLDSEKCNGARVCDEAEVLATTGNALEVFLLSDSVDVLTECVGPDDEYLRSRFPFSSLGAASTYIPVDQWQARNQSQRELRILERELLCQQHEPLPTDSPAAEFATRQTDLRQLVTELVAGCPFTVLGQNLGSSASGDAERLLQAAHLDRPAMKEWPPLPLPEVSVDPSVGRAAYRWEDPVDGRSHRLPPEEWLQHLYLHFRRLGLPPDEIFPGDPEAAVFEEAVQGEQQIERERWRELMRETSGVPRGETAAAGSAPHEPGGIVPQWAAALRQEAIRLLETEGQGLPGAVDWLRDLSRSLRQALAQAEDYQARLLRALGSQAQHTARTVAAQHRLAFRRLLGNRPQPASLLGRLLALSSLVTTAGVRIFSPHGPAAGPAPLPLPVGVQPWLGAHPLLAAAGMGLGLGALAFAATLGVHRLRLWRAIRRVERDLLRELSLLANLDVATAVAGSDTDPGLLPSLVEEAVLLGDVFLDTRSGLTRRREELSADLAEAMAPQGQFVREPLAGLEDWEQQLLEAAGAAGEPLLPPAILSADRQVAERLLQDFVASEVEQARARRAGDRQLDGLAPSQTRERQQVEQETRSRLDEIAERFRTVRRGRRSLAELLAETVAQAAQARDIVPPDDLRIELLLRQKVKDFSPASFLADLCSRGQINLAWDREVLPRHLPVLCGLVSLETDASLLDAAGTMAELGLRRAVSFHPLSVTVVQMCHGLSVAAIPHYQAYGEDFQAVGEERRSALAIAPVALSRAGEYLQVASSEGGDEG